MRAYVSVRTRDGVLHRLAHGDFVGRLWSAALRFDDGRVSEAHALVSLRGDRLHLLALRGLFRVAGRRSSEVALEPGVEVELAPGLTLTVDEVHLPETVLGLEGDGLPRQVLAGVCSLQLRPEPELTPGFHRKAPARLWSTDAGWTLDLGGEDPRPLPAGETFELEGRSFRAVEIRLADAAEPATRHAGPMRIVASFDTVELHSPGRAPLVLSGVQARLVSELVALDGPARWDLLAGLLWPDEAEPSVVRRRLDVTLSRLRRRLREAGMRTDLVHADGAGSIVLLLDPEDRVEDRS